MSIRIPRGADVDVQAAFRDVEQQLDDLAAKGATGGVDPSADLASLVARIEQLEKRPRLNSDKDVFVAAGTQHSAGLVPDPGTYTSGNLSLVANGEFGNPDLLRLDDEDQSARGVDDIYTLPGSLHVNGGISADRLLVRDLDAFPHYCRAVRVAAQSIANATWTAISLDTEQADTDGFFAPTSKVLTIPAGLGGLYLIHGGVYFASAAGGTRAAALSVNESTDAATGLFEDARSEVTNVDSLVQVQSIYRLAAGDTVTLKVYQTLTVPGSLNTANLALARNFGTSLDIMRIGA